MLMNCSLYRDGLKVAASSDVSELFRQACTDGGFVWIGLKDPVAAEFVEIAETFSLHPLAVEDSVHAQQRAKLEDYGDLEFLVLKTLHYDDASSQIETGDLMLYIGHNFIVTVRHGDSSELTDIRSELEAQPEQLAHGPYAVVHAVMDRVVDAYGLIARELDHDVADLESRVFSTARAAWSQHIYFLKREVIEFRRATEPLRPILARLVSDTQLHVPTPIRPFFRDIDDHLNRAADTSAGLDQLLTSALNADMAQVQLRQNEDMRRITAWVALAAGPTMVAGIYGMNFQYMPELSSPYGYRSVLVGLAIFSSWLFLKFKRSGWL